MSDYKQRMIREHRELQERISKLAHMLEGYAEGTLDFTPACSSSLKANCTRWGHTRTSYRSVRVSNRWI